MDKKAFLILLVILLAVYSFCFAIRGFQPEISAMPNIADFPLHMEGWIGQPDNLAPGIVDLLNPTLVFSATYTNERGVSVHLFFDYFAHQSALGGPHSPRNCMPGSGWTVLNDRDIDIASAGNEVNAGRFDISKSESKMIMDYWYITRYGETANDYVFKFYTMISALAFKPNDVAFVRILANGDPESKDALEEFESLFVSEIYNHLGFK